MQVVIGMMLQNGLNNLKRNNMTAVEWLLDRVEDVDLNPNFWEQIKLQALELEKQQIIDAANIPKEQRWYENKYDSCGEQYYFETYKPEAE
jgi:hypothetical protein